MILTFSDAIYLFLKRNSNIHTEIETETTFVLNLTHQKKLIDSTEKERRKWIRKKGHERNFRFVASVQIEKL